MSTVIRPEILRTNYHQPLTLRRAAVYLGLGAAALIGCGAERGVAPAQTTPKPIQTGWAFASAPFPITSVAPECPKPSYQTYTAQEAAKIIVAHELLSPYTRAVRTAQLTAAIGNDTFDTRKDKDLIALLGAAEVLDDKLSKIQVAPLRAEAAAGKNTGKNPRGPIIVTILVTPATVAGKPVPLLAPPDAYYYLEFSRTIVKGDKTTRISSPLFEASLTANNTVTAEVKPDKELLKDKSSVTVYYRQTSYRQTSTGGLFPLVSLDYPFTVGPAKKPTADAARQKLKGVCSGRVDDNVLEACNAKCGAEVAAADKDNKMAVGNKCVAKFK
ncbi:MAG: hypothetical protein WC624_03035 [Candidatus Margulisiibacteriota bacterium]